VSAANESNVGWVQVTSMTVGAGTDAGPDRRAPIAGLQCTDALRGGLRIGQGAAMTSDAGLPGRTQRWRCAQCGNLTRFDLTRIRRTREYVHVDLAGVPTIEETEVLAEDVLAVTCRWCGSASVEVVARPDAG
jgi:hypothetical protein